MHEIRIRWYSGLHAEEAGDATAGGEWLIETPEVLRDYEILVATGCEVCGAHSHWIERR